LKSTSFYYESGGQCSDIGVLGAEGVQFKVLTAQSYAGYVVHVGELQEGTLAVGQEIDCNVDYENRSYVAPNHTMTHVLNYALKSVLVGDRPDSQGLCDQKGSLVDSSRLRFDFAWGGAVPAKQIEQIESIVIDKIKAELTVYAEVVPLAQATNISSLRAVFGERYPDPVRVISVGTDVQALIADPKNPNWDTLSVEFCGGTHLSNTKEAEDFVLIEESGIAKGVRRISGLTRKGAREARARAAELMDRLQRIRSLEPGPEMTALSKAIKMDVDQAVVSLVDKEKMRAELAAIAEALKVYNKALSATRVAAALSAIDSIAETAVASSQAFVVEAMDFGADGKVAKKIQDKFRAIHGEGTLLLASMDEEGERIGLFPVVSEKHVAGGLSAKEWCDHCIAVVGAGKGGGKADLANASIPGDSTVLEAVLEAAKKFAETKLNA